MGTQQSLTPTPSNPSTLQQYTFIKPLSDTKNLYTHNHTRKQFISVERTFPSQETLIEYEQRMRKLLEVRHPYFLNETEHAMVASSTLCSVHYRVVHLFQCEMHTLEQELETRRKHGRYFQEKEVWSILCSSVLAMAHLTKNDIPCYMLHPRDIIIDSQGMTKITSPLLTDHPSQQQPISPQLYYSPQHLKHLKSQCPLALTNKSSVFTLGITLLHILSLEPMNELYNYQNFTINMELLGQLVEKISQQEIREIIRRMVKGQGWDRITWTELEEMLYDVLEGGGREGQGSERTGGEDGEDHEGMGHSRLETSIHRLTHQQNQPLVETSTPLIYHTGSSTQRQNHPSNPLPADQQDTPNLPPSFESRPDTQNVDEEDAPTTTRRQEQFEANVNNQMKESHFTNTSHRLQENGEDDKTVRKALGELRSQFNVTLGGNNSIGTNNKPTTLIDPSTTLTKTTPPTNTSTFPADPKPYHCRQQLKRGIYQGYKLHNMRHGYGVFYYTQGGKYAGEWVRNKMQGRGALYYTDNQVAYEGEWHSDKLHGYGVLYNEQPGYAETRIDYRTLSNVRDAWVKYEGNFVEDEKQGEGTLFLSNGEYWRGQWMKDLPNGKGVFKTRGGDLVKGVWVMGVLQ